MNKAPASAKKRQKRKFIILGAACVAAASLFALSWCTQQAVTSSQAVLKKGLFPVFTQIQGSVSKVYVEKGQRVNQGYPLFAINNDKYAKEYAEAQARLMELETRVPPEKLIHLQKHADDLSTPATLGTHLERLQQQEKEAQRQVMELSAINAKGALEAHTARLRWAKGEMTEAQTAPVIEKQLRLQKDLDQAKKNLELISLDRAALERDITHIRQIQNQEHISEETVTQRVKSYEAQLAATREAKKKLDATTVVAPIDGTVHDLTIREGVFLTPDVLPVSILPLTPSFTVEALFDGEAVNRIRTGMACLIFLPDNSAAAPINGRVTEISATPTIGTGKSTSSDNAASYYYPVTIIPQKIPDLPLLNDPGRNALSVTVKVLLQGPPVQAVTIPGN